LVPRIRLSSAHSHHNSDKSDLHHNSCKAHRTEAGDENDDGLDEDKLNCSMHYKKRKDDCRTTVIGGSGREQNMKKM
ncbi:hypothetical protein T02_10871, partial [Trichinella nativa]